MELELWRECQQTLANASSAADAIPLRTLSTVRSLIVNPSTSDATVSSIIETLSHHHDHHLRHRALPLLSALSLVRPNLSHLILSSVLSLLSSSSSAPLSAAAALSLLISLAESNPSLGPSVDSIDDSILASLCFRPCVRSRLWLLSNASRFRIRPHLLVTVLLGFTNDPFPDVRIAALNGLSKASAEAGIVVGDLGIAEGCFIRAIELLEDAEEGVREAAVRVASVWGQMLVASKSQGNEREWCDVLFLQLCTMVRDMSMAVRVEVFNAIGRTGLVSEDVLLMTLSKRCQRETNKVKTVSLSSGQHYKIGTSCAAGAFLHGVEDEFTEVRWASCNALDKVMAISAHFATEAVTLLMIAMNDDSVMVRLQAMATLHQMSASNHIKMQQEHVLMFVNTLADSCPQVRDRVMKVLGSARLPDFKSFQFSVGSLVQNLSLYPQDEVVALHTLFRIGHNHGQYALRIIEGAYNEMMFSSSCKVAFETTNLIAHIILAISASLSDQASRHRIPPKIFSYAAVFLGRISSALKDVMNKDTLLAHLSCCSRSSLLFSFKGGGNDCKDNSTQQSSLGTAMMETDDTTSDIRTKCKARMDAPQLAGIQEEDLVEVLQSANHVLQTIKISWKLVKSGDTNEALKTLRSCKEELKFIRAGPYKSLGPLAFGLQYILVVEVVTKLWGHIISAKRHSYGVGNVELLLEKLDQHLVDLRHRFTGLSKEEELYILELVLLSCVLRYSRVQECSIASNKLSTTVSQVIVLCEVLSAPPSDFVSQLSKACQEDCFSGSMFLYNPQLARKMFDLFSPKDILLSGSIKHINAELKFPGFNSESPLPFIPGLPVGIPCEIALYNLSHEHRLWLIMKVDENNSHFVFLDYNHIEECTEVQKVLYNAPLNRTPKATAFTLRISLGMECLSEENHRMRGLGGPRCRLAYLCEEQEVELYSVGKVR